MPDQPLLKVTGATSHYGRIQALHGIDLEIFDGELVALVGGNGAGKTTLLRAISGVQPLSGGDIALRGDSLSSTPADRRVELGISQVPEGRQVFGAMSVEDNILLGGFTRTRSEAEEDMKGIYAMFPILEQKKEQPAGTLSGGQQQMLAMGRALMARPKILLLDEPSMGLAPNLVEEIFAKVIELKKAGTTIFLVEQNAFAALSIADRGYVLETGTITHSDTGKALLADEKVKEAYLGVG